MRIGVGAEPLTLMGRRKEDVDPCAAVHRVVDLLELDRTDGLPPDIDHEGDVAVDELFGDLPGIEGAPPSRDRGLVQDAKQRVRIAGPPASEDDPITGQAHASERT